jgi:hypothetical protein
METKYQRHCSLANPFFTQAVKAKFVESKKSNFHKGALAAFSFLHPSTLFANQNNLAHIQQPLRPS